MATHGEEKKRNTKTHMNKLGVHFEKILETVKTNLEQDKEEGQSRNEVVF